MNNILKQTVAISGFFTLIATNSISVNAHEKMLPSVGIVSEIQNFTEEEALAAYTEKVEEEINEEELKILSSIIWCEAGNQCEAGKQAVGIVVMNRVEEEANFGSTIEEVIYYPGQFRSRGDKGLAKAFSIYDTHLPDYEWERMQLCIEAAKYALAGNKVVQYNGREIDMSEYYYFARKWAKARVRIQDHDFK